MISVILRTDAPTNNPAMPPYATVNSKTVSLNKYKLIGSLCVMQGKHVYNLVSSTT